MSVVEHIEIISDKTIELLDENNENILLRMMLIKNECNDEKEYIVLDSKKRFYIIDRLFSIIPKIENLYYSPFCGLGYINNWMERIVNIKCCDDINVITRTTAMCRYFYDIRDEYLPQFGLSNFELK